MGWLEAAAVAFGLAYLLLAVREHQACWYAAFIGTGLSVWLFWSVSLPMESALNVYYLAMAVYGWWQWRGPSKASATGPAGVEQVELAGAASGLPIRRFSMREHVLAGFAVAALTMLSGSLLQANTTAALPYLDSFTTWASVLTTWMVAKKVLENWLYWLVIDAAAIVLYLDRELYLYAGLFAVYLVIAVFGWRAWSRSYHRRDRSEPQPFEAATSKPTDTMSTVSLKQQN